jgi:hypothetical protein
MASVVSNVEIYEGNQDGLNKLHIPIATAVTVAPGDLIKTDGTTATVMTAASDNASFIGLSLDVSKNGDTIPINVLLRGRAIIGCTSSTYAIGEALAWATGANGTDWTVAAVTSGADGTFFSLEYKASAVTTLKVQWDSFLIGASIGGGAGRWEGFAS